MGELAPAALCIKRRHSICMPTLHVLPDEAQHKVKGKWLAARLALPQVRPGRERGG